MAKLTMPQLPDIAEILARVDMDQTLEAMSEDKIRDVDMRDARELVLRACETWLPRDVVDLNVTGLEEPLDSEYRGWKIKGYKDMNGTIVGASPTLAPYAGKTFILDWKTTKNHFTTEWKNRLLDSWQWKMYCAHTPVQIFIYRGINRYGECKEVMMEVPTWEMKGLPVAEYEVKQQYDLLIDYLEVLEGRPGPWLRNMPSSCYAYRRQCPYYEGSCEYADFPEWTFGKENRPRLSYTMMDHFMLCQERVRRELHFRDTQPNASSEESEYSLFGNCIHRGLADIYGQVFGIEVTPRQKSEEDENAPETND